MPYTITEENYLKAIFNLSENGQPVNVHHLAEVLNIKMPTVTAMIKKLAEKGLVNYTSYKPVTLTEQGRLFAAKVIRKHRLTEMFLVEQMKLGWEEVHDIAEQIEHIKSPVFFEQMDALLNYPNYDPHGEPIPDNNGKIIRANRKSLDTCKEGEIVILTGVTKYTDDFLKLLNNRDLSLGAKLKIHSVEPFDQSMKIEYGEGRIELFSKKICERLLVQSV